MMQGWLDECAMFGLRIEFLMTNLGLGYKTEQRQGMFTGQKTNPSPPDPGQREKQ